MSNHTIADKNAFIINESTPWKDPKKSVPTGIFRFPGETNKEERLLYYWICNELYRGVGEIVEIGALLGASSTSLALGVLDNPRVANKERRIHVFDKFEAYEHQVNHFFPANNIEGLRVGDDFSHIYRQNIQPLESMLDVNVGDILDVTWQGGPIEILFIDCAISIEISNAIISKFYPHLIPCKSLIIDQDFFFQRCWWFAYKNEVLSNVLTPKYAEDCTMVSHCVGDMQAELPRLNLLNAPLEQRIKILQTFIGRMTGFAKQLVTLQLAWMMADNGQADVALSYAATIADAPLTPDVLYRARKTMTHIEALTAS
jgi:hypothetical protein